MDPEEVMKRLRDAMIEISDMVSARLSLGGSSLDSRELDEVISSADAVSEHAKALQEWYSHGGYRPKGLR